MAMAVACSAIAMEALQIHASSHLLLPHRQSLAHGLRLPVPPRSRRPAQRLLLLHIACNLPGQGNDQKNLHRPAPASEHRRKVASGFREDRRRKRGSFRLSLRARLRLLLRALPRLSPSTLALLLRGFPPLQNRAHQKQVALSLLVACALSLGLLCLKVTSVPSPHSVPYSDLVKYLDSGAVSSVLFEEGSRQVLFNMKPGEETSENGLRNPTLPLSSSSAAKKLIIAHRDPVTVYSSDGNVADGSEMEAILSAPNEMPGAIEEDMFKHLQSHALQSSTQVHDETVNGVGIDSPSQSHGETTDDTAESIDELSSPHNSDGATGRKKEWEAIKSIGASFKSVFRIPEGMLKAKPQPWRYVTRRIENDEAYLLGLMREKGVRYRSAPQSMSASLRATLFTILSLWIPLAPLFWLMYKQFSSSNSAAQKKHLGSIRVKFEDVAGVDEAKVELVEIVSCLRGTMDFRRLGAKLPKGVLLVGPPGTGKTLLARAVAGEAGVPFFAASASEFVEMFVGRGAARIRELFSSARKYSPSIIFIDELDAVGGRRGRSFNDERDQTLNQLLTEMDGFESETGVLVIAATNRAEALDPALCRPGRFSRKVFVKEPDFNGRQQILAVHMRGIPMEGDVKAAQSIVASITAGFVGADLANVVNEAALLAVRTGREAVTIEDLKEAVDRVKFGVGNKPMISGAVERMFDWLQQPKASKSPPSGYEAPSWNG